MVKWYIYVVEVGVPSLLLDPTQKNNDIIGIITNSDIGKALDLMKE